MNQPWRLALLALGALLAAGACVGAASAPPAGPTAPAGGGAPQAAADGGAAPAPSAAPRPRAPFTLAVPERNLNYIVPIATARLGFFDDVGLDVRVDGMPANLISAAMQRGDLQLSGAGGSAIRAAVQGAPFRLVSFMTVRATLFLLTQPELRSPSQLPGRRIGVSNVAGSQQFFTEIYAREQGVDPSQIAFAGMGANPAQSLAAMQVGALDGAVFDPAMAAVAEKQGYFLMRALGEVVPEPFQGLVATDEYIQQKPDEVQAFLTGLVRGLLYAKQHQREVAAIAREELGLDMDEATALRAVQLYTDGISAEAPGYADAKLMEAFYLYDVRIPLELPADQPIPVLHDFRYLLGAYDTLGIPRPQ
jgi:NitT/TauT family transport system substrate-binding protein